jgi:hypothetical protein
MNNKDKYWKSFQDLSLLKPGDFLVYLPPKYTPKEITKIPTGRTGMHVMIVEEVLEIETQQIRLKIIDCTRFRHCWEDDRVKGGIGRAPLTIHIQKEGTVLQWGSRKKKYEKDLFCGRLISSN